MSLELHRLGEIFIRVILPGFILPTGAMLAVYGITLLASQADATSWTITLLGSCITLGSVLLLVFGNTSRARARWKSYVSDEDESSDGKV